MTNSGWNDPEANVLPEKVEELQQNGEIPNGDQPSAEVQTTSSMANYQSPPAEKESWWSVWVW
jgi:hypothetical protein